jgi:hypothetical protein
MAVTKPTATNTPATLPAEVQNDDDRLTWASEGCEKLSGCVVGLFVSPDVEFETIVFKASVDIVVEGSLGTKLVMNTVVP